MKSETTLLMLSLLIPVNEDVSADQIMDIIGRQINEAVQEIQARQSRYGPDRAREDADGSGTSGDAGSAEADEPSFKETLEAYSTETRDDQLVKLGYADPD